MAETKNSTTQIGGKAVSRENVEKNTHNFDELKMFFGEPFEVGNGLTIYQPTIGQMMEVGEEDFYAMLYMFIGNPTMFRLQLWDVGVDWNKITSYDLFKNAVTSINKKYSDLLFGDIDFSTFGLYNKTLPPEDDETPITVQTLYSPDLDIEISEESFTLIAEYLRTMFNIFPKVEKAKGRLTKEAIIEEDRMNLAAKMKEKKPSGSSLLPLISACINHPGFKYKLSELKEVGICQFMDSVQRLQLYESAVALMGGMYGGWIDSSKISSDSYNWMKSLRS